MPFAELETGIRIHYRDGEGDKPMIFIPGIAATLETWNYQVLALQEQYRCVCVDLRGHGGSDKPYSKYTYDELCGDLRALILRLDLNDITLIGWSMGAGVCLKYVSDFDDESRITKLAMLAPATPRLLATETEPFGADAGTAAATLEGMRIAYPETMAAFAGANFHRDELQATANWFLSEWLETPAYVAYRCFQSLLREDLRDRLAGLSLPTLICHGRHDLVCDPRWSEYMAARIPDCRMEWFENSSHALMVEEPEALSRQLATFVG